MSDRRLVAVGLLAASCGWFSSPPEAPPPKPHAPNVLLIVWDTVRADRLSTYGYDKPTSPRLDAFAREGRVYEQAVSPGVWTLPSHGSLFTGLPVSAHGIDADNKWLDDAHVTIAEALLEGGYDTYSFCANPYISKDTNLLQGFEQTEYPWTKRWKERSKEALEAKLIPEDASSTVSPLWQGAGISAGGKRYLYKEAGPVAHEAFTAWLDERGDTEQPFFAFINYMEAHLPRVPTMAARQKVMTPEQIERSMTVEQSSDAFHEWMIGVREYDEGAVDAISAVYDASLVDLDAATGDLLDDLRSRGVLDDTIVIITSDHGENVGDHDLMLHKYAVYGSLSRVPLVVRYPSRIEPGREHAPISTAEIIDLLVDLGVPVPDGFRKDLKRRRKARPDGVVTEYRAIAEGSLDKLHEAWPDADLSRFYTTFEAVELHDHKLIVSGEGVTELYDVADDPAERDDQAESQPERVLRMRKELEAWRGSFEPWVREERSEEAMTPEMKEALEALGYVGEGGEP